MCIRDRPSDAAKQPKVHRIRLAKMFFEDVASGKKPFELRKNDIGYKPVSYTHL